MSIAGCLGAFRCGLCLASLDAPSAFCRSCTADLPWRCSPEAGESDFPLTATFWFEPPVNWLLNAAKFDKNPAIFRQLGALMASRAMPQWATDYVVCPIPLRWERQLRRGFNQSFLLGDVLARQFGWDLQPGWLSRIGSGRSQKNLGRTARMTLAANVFSGAPEVSARRILLVDDVHTTGATLRAARGALLAAGAANVAAWVCAIVR